jgi:hypothetical protein
MSESGRRLRSPIRGAYALRCSDAHDVGGRLIVQTSVGRYKRQSSWAASSTWARRPDAVDDVGPTRLEAGHPPRAE